MNTEDFVTYEQAENLYLLGFREKCFYHYNNDKELIPNGDCAYDYDKEVTAEDILNSYNEYGDGIDAPTLAQAQKWLRKVKKLSIEPLSGDTDGPGWEYCLTDRNPEYPTFHFNNVTYSSYEEALSAGITECLKLLENG